MLRTEGRTKGFYMASCEITYFGRIREDREEIKKKCTFALQQANRYQGYGKKYHQKDGFCIASIPNCIVCQGKAAKIRYCNSRGSRSHLCRPSRFGKNRHI